ncbi:MAG: serine/threonine-protein kinase [Betaproteobacteria bacterium]
MATGQSLGRYEIRRELGRGAMGVVYEAYDPLIKRVVALKTIREDQLDRAEAPIVIARFRREAEAAGRLHHPNIVSIFDFGDDAGTAYIAMEFVAGRDLKSRFDAGERFATAEAIRLTAQILDALDYAHRHGVVHRDIKAANVFVQEDGTVKVADFGIAHLDSSSLTQAGSVMGTPSSMSPEQILGLPVDARTDVFSTGVILYQFVTGERPFGGAATTTTMQKVLKEEPLAPSTLNVQLPDAMDAIVKRALAKKPDDRYASAAEFAAALRALAGPRVSSAPRVGAAAVPSYDGEATFVAPSAARNAPSVWPADPPAAPVPASVPAPVERAVAPAATPAPAASPPRAPAYARAGGTTIIAARSNVPAIAFAVGVVALATAGGLWWFMQHSASNLGRIGALPAASSTAPEATPPAAAASSASTGAPASASPTETGSVVIAATGWADPGDPRYQGDPSRWQAALRADARGQVIDKALGLLADRTSLTTNYDAVGARMAPMSGDFIRAVVRESAPVVGKDGLATMTTEAVVNVKALQKSLNEMTARERIELIRAHGDPRISIAIATRDADRLDAAAQRSPVAENLIKERIKAFGFRTWSEDAPDAGKAADFSVTGEARLKRLSTRLEASGIVVNKFALTSWTVKAVDRATGEEIYHDTTLPAGTGSWATEEEALKAIGTRVADAFSRDFFLKHVSPAARRVALVVDGLPEGRLPDLLLRELVALPSVLSVRARAGASPRTFDLDLAGSGPAVDLVANGILAPINAKLGKSCLAPAGSTGDEVRVRFDAGCSVGDAIVRLETLPPAGLYGAPPSRQKAVIRSPETLKKLTV